METNPLEVAESASEGNKESSSRRNLNTGVAIMVALLATFMGLCKVKDDNIVQAMQQAQAKSIDTWSWYQAKKIRVQVAQSSAEGMEVQAMLAGASGRADIQKKIDDLKRFTEAQTRDLTNIEAQARGYDKSYDQLNVHDDQFDLSDAMLALAISLFAVTSLTQKKWLFFLAMVPTAFGLVFGLAGLFNLSLHSDFFAKLLGT